MADDQHDQSEQAEGVRLVSPQGAEVTVRSPEAVNNLVYGQGYRLRGDDDPEAAIKAADDGNGGDEQSRGEQTEAPSTPTVTATRSAPKTGGKTAPTPPTT